MNEKAFICLLQVLEKCKRWGYTEVWINHVNPHWTNSSTGGMIVAAPKQRNSSPALWGLGYHPLEREMLGSMSCGNGLKFADQMQFSLVGKNYDAQYYRLCNGKWLTEQEIYGTEEAA